MSNLPYVVPCSVIVEKDGKFNSLKEHDKRIITKERQRTINELSEEIKEICENNSEDGLILCGLINTYLRSKMAEVNE